MPVIAIDASAAVEMLRGGSLGEFLQEELLNRGEPLIAPHLLDIEAVSSLRRLMINQRIDSHRAREIIEDLQTLPVRRYEHTPLLDRIWELRHNFTAYDATYIALAEVTGAVLYTCDQKLAKGHRAKVRVFALA